MAALALWSALLLALWPTPSIGATGAATIGIVTIVEGDVTVQRDTERFAAAEGLRLRSDDIVSTADGARLARIELDDGKAIDLGPGTRVLLQPRALARQDRSSTLYVGSGWVKVASPPKAAAPLSIASQRLDATRITGTAILRVGPADDWLFVESGVVDALQRRDGRPSARQSLKEGDSLALHDDGGLGSVSWLPAAELLKQMPRPFVDTLPRRAARFADTVVKPARAVEVSYADVAPWINGEAVLRAAFVQRLSSLAKQGHFRYSLIAELRLHPEWQRVLFPPPPPEPVARIVQTAGTSSPASKASP